MYFWVRFYLMIGIFIKVKEIDCVLCVIVSVGYYLMCLILVLSEVI